MSWRVHWLPAWGLQKHYAKFQMDEPWDSPHNKALLTEIPRFLQHPSDPVGHTRVRTALRLDGEREQQTRIGQIEDGLDNTTVMVIVGEGHAIPWTQPDSAVPLLECTRQKIQLSDWGIKANEKQLMTFAGGSWDFRRYHEPILAAMITPAGGELLQLRPPSFFLYPPQDIASSPANPISDRAAE